MKILIVSNIYPSPNFPYKGVFVKKVSDILDSHGFEVERSVLETKRYGVINKLWSYIKYVVELINKLKNHNYDIIYVHYINHSLLPLLVLGKEIQRKVVLNAHGGDIITIGFLNSLISRFTRKYVRKCGRAIVPSVFLKNKLINEFGYKGKVHIYPSGGVNTAKFKPHGKLPSPSFTVLYFGRIEEGKGWETFLKSIEIVNQRIKVEALIVGHGKESNRMKDEIVKRKLSNITYNGPIDHQHAPELFSTVDIMVFPTTREESLGLVALESMACGVPVIATKIGAIPEYIENDVNGFLVPVNSPDQIALKILKFESMSKTKQEEISTKAREKAFEYDDEKHGKLLAEYFNSLKLEN